MIPSRSRRRRLIRIPGAKPIHLLRRPIHRKGLVETNGTDPGGWLHIFAGGVLAAAAKWVWDRLVRTPRPVRAEHSNAFMLAELRQIRDSVDGVAGTVQGLEDRVLRLEQRRSNASASGTD